MVDPDKYISDGLGVIRDLMKQNNLTLALKACQELLRVNPYHRDLKKMLEKVEEKLLEQNAAKVDADISATMHLWDEKKYDQLAQVYAKLRQYYPDHPRLQKLIAKLQKSADQSQRAEQEDFLKRAAAVIEVLLQEKKFGDAIQASNELTQALPLREEAKHLLARVKHESVESQLEENQRLSESSDFERMVAVYESLLAIDPAHKTLQRLLAQAKAHLAEKRVLASRIHLNESIERMKQLFSGGEYEKVLQACDEILRLDEKNVTAKVFKKKAKATIRREIDLFETNRLKAHWALLRAQVAKNPEKFLQI